MTDTYSRFVLTVIALALIWIGIRPSTSPVDAQSITSVRVVGFDLSAPLPVVNGGPPFNVNVVQAAVPLAVTVTSPLPLPIVTR
ncbi:hypothetical protein [Hyphomicrobium sp. MC1]|uniref:hypothetical protein n=1 Tax=Hyphomicrobium sp. (strain MC1) TaxID=717785 RepID=UPI000213D390|nr:hypothetical protein [Hyphomicrobium sp. MC1]CCB66221.1 exported protein of unknown function [Hyphomicrobium sp. MC1]